jgi:lactoylglutathione lyase
MAIQIHYWTDDVERALSYYTKVLGFDLTYRQPDEGDAEFCILKLGDATLMFAQRPSSEISDDRNDSALLELAQERVGTPGPISVYIALTNVADFAADAEQCGARIVEPLWKAPWGLDQFSVLDPDGNLTTFHSQ